jgi:hypothetical protein
MNHEITRRLRQRYPGLPGAPDRFASKLGRKGPFGRRTRPVPSSDLSEVSGIRGEGQYSSQASSATFARARLASPSPGCGSPASGSLSARQRPDRAARAGPESPNQLIPWYNIQY